MTADHRLGADRLDAIGAAATVLSRWLLAAPDDEALARVREPAMLDHWPLGPSRGVAQFDASREAAEDAEAARTDHRLLFMGPGPMRAAPYESVHRSRDQLVFDEQTVQVREAYARVGLAAPRQGRDPDDHIGLELEFVATLCSRLLDAADADDRAEQDHLLRELRAFVGDHLLPWAPALGRQIADRAETHLYRGVGLLVVDVVEQLRAELGIEADQDRP